jgi:hypothetical protein
MRAPLPNVKIGNPLTWEGSPPVMVANVPSSQVSCSKSTALRPLCFTSPCCAHYPHTEHLFLHTKTTLTSPILLSGTSNPLGKESEVISNPLVNLLLSRTKKTEIVNVVVVNSAMGVEGWGRGERVESQRVSQLLPDRGPGRMRIHHHKQGASPPSK